MLNDKAFACKVVGFPGTAAPVLDLEPFEVGFVLLYFNEWHGDELKLFLIIYVNE